MWILERGEDERHEFRTLPCCKVLLATWFVVVASHSTLSTTAVVTSNDPSAGFSPGLTERLKVKKLFTESSLQYISTKNQKECMLL